MSLAKELRDEAFREWKRALIAREPSGTPQPAERQWIVKPAEPAVDPNMEEARQYWEGADIEAREREAIDETMKEFKESLKFLKDWHDQADGGH